MPHLNTGPGEKDSTISAFIVRTDGSEPRALVHLHRKLGRLLPLGGHIEDDQTPWQATAAEVEQESGFLLSQLSVLQPVQRIKSLPKVILHPYPVVLNTHPITPDHDHRDIAFAFVTQEDPKGQMGEGESLDLRWLTESELDRLDETEIYPMVKSVYQFIFDVCLSEWEAVPATAFEL